MNGFFNCAESEKCVSADSHTGYVTKDLGSDQTPHRALTRVYSFCPSISRVFTDDFKFIVSHVTEERTSTVQVMVRVARLTFFPIR